MSKSYTGVEDILCDDRFLSWYFKTDIRASRQWEQWMADNPGSGPRVLQAVEFLQSLHVHEAGLMDSELTRVEKRLLEKIRRGGLCGIQRSPAGEKVCEAGQSRCLERS